MEAFRWVLATLILLYQIAPTLESSAEWDGKMSSSCPNACSLQGACMSRLNYGSLGVCSCFPGFHGVDCSLRLCPGGKAWVDFPVSNNRAHNNFTECSNMGVCNRVTGSCQCRFGFGGPACDTLLCPRGASHSLDFDGTVAPCSGNGRCITLRQAAVLQDYVNFFNYTSYSDWDADMIQGCACQKGWEGPACNQRSCPKSIDPLVPAVNEVQLIDCKCTTCSGGVYLTFRGKETAFIPYDASRELVRLRLEQLSTVEQVSLRFISQTKLCSSTGSVLRIEFKLPRGNLQSMSIRTSGTLAGTINLISSGAYSTLQNSESSVDGTYDYKECSNRGDCDYSTGTCHCYAGYASSNGAGASGARGDCGYLASENVTFDLRSYDTDVYNASFFPNYWKGIVAVSKTTKCPFTVTGGICNGKGICASVTNTCMCNSGYEGPRCDRKSCGKAKTWFGDVSLEHSRWSVCGGVGTCDYTSGKCVDCGGDWGVFQGDQCQYLSCPSNSSGSLCSGQGQCYSMRNLASVAYTDTKEKSHYTYTKPWDVDAIYGCACYRSPTVDNLFFDWLSNPLNINRPDPDPQTFFYRGPYANAATDFAGYLCSAAKCPRGDNPATRSSVNEVQLMTCTASSGNFTITFRENTTLPISSNTSAANFEYKLQLLKTIRKVSVTLQGAGAWRDHICGSAGDISVFIEFETEFGDLPMLKAGGLANLLHGSAASGSVTFVEYQKGTKEDTECSGQGICDENTGVCQCVSGYSSSNSSTGFAGDRGDCSFRGQYL